MGCENVEDKKLFEFSLGSAKFRVEDDVLFANVALTYGRWEKENMIGQGIFDAGRCYERKLLEAEIARLNAAIWEERNCGEPAPLQCDVPMCSGRWMCSKMTEGWKPAAQEGKA